MNKKPNQDEQNVSRLAERLGSVVNIKRDNPGLMHMWYDSEFTSLSLNGELISIAIISETGSWFYAEFNDYDEQGLGEWVRNNVHASLIFNDRDTYRKRKNLETTIVNEQIYSIMMKDNSEKIRKDLLKWLNNELKVRHIQNDKVKQICFYMDASTYDWAYLMDLICDDGDALNLPHIIAPAPYDLCTFLHHIGDIPVFISRKSLAGEEYVNKIKKVEPFNGRRFANINMEHNALYDAAVLLGCCIRLMIE